MLYLKVSLALLGALCAASGHAAGPTGLLNDTGQTSCYDASHAAVACAAGGVGSDAGDNPRQDARFGRDVAGVAKTGAGAAGFDYTKVCMSGELAGSGACPANPPQGTNANEWACTKDNVTNLIWSIEVFAFKTWAEATDTAGGGLIAGYNTASRCGFATNWRPPTRRELLSVAIYDGRSPAIDLAYFPGTVATFYWTSDSYAPDLTLAWSVGGTGGSQVSKLDNNLFVRLVRSGL
jgi:hypothetical protein